MSQHFTRRTVSAAAYCNKCGKQTQHRIDDRRLGPCLECIARNDALVTKPKKTAAQQGALSFPEGGAA
jgi:hypothetical protein